MEKIIVPLMNPDELRAAAATQQPQPAAQPLGQQVPDATLNSSQADHPPSANAAVALAIIDHKEKPLIGLYVIVAIMLLSALAELVGSRGNTTHMISGAITAIIALGLLTKSNFVRTGYLILGGLNFVLGLIGLEGMFGNSAAHIQKVSSRGAMIAVLFVAIQAGTLIYLTLPRVKAHFE